MAASRLKTIEQQREWWSFHELPMKAWDLYEDALTARLDPKSLKAVTQAVVSLRTISDSIRVALAKPPPLSYVDVTESTAQIRKMREEATAAYNALAKLAEEAKVSGLLHED